MKKIIALSVIFFFLTFMTACTTERVILKVDGHAHLNNFKILERKEKMFTVFPLNIPPWFWFWTYNVLWNCQEKGKEYHCRQVELEALEVD